MKNNITTKYFKQDGLLLVIDIILIAIATVAAFIATFIQGGGPVGLAVLAVCAIAFIFLRSVRVKDSDIDELIDTLLRDNKIEISESTISTFDFRYSEIKKRKDGKWVSDVLYVAELDFETSKDVVLNVNRLDLTNESVENTTYTIGENTVAVLNEDTVRTKFGTKNVTYLVLNNGEITVPVTLDNYKIAERLAQICKNKP